MGEKNSKQKNPGLQSSVAFLVWFVFIIGCEKATLLL